MVFLSSSRRSKLGCILLALAAFVSEAVYAAPQTPGSRDSSFATGSGVVGEVTELVLQPDGRAVLLGGFDYFNGALVGRGVRLNPNGSRDTSFAVSITGIIQAAARQADGRLVLGGNFGWYQANNLARVLGSGADDLSFSLSGGASNAVSAVAIDSSGRSLVGGNFQNFDGNPWKRLVRLTPTGAIDTSFNTQGGASAQVRCIAVQPDGRILVGGSFATFGGVASPGIVRLLDSGQVDSSFSVGSGFDLVVNDIELEPDGKILVVGGFSTFNGTPAERIARLLSDGTLDPSFAPSGGANQSVQCITRLPSGRIMVGGDFTAFAGLSAPRLALLTTLGTPVVGFNTGSGPSDRVSRIVPVTDSLVLVAGRFATFNGQPSGGIARIWTDYVCFVDGDGDGFGSGPALYGSAPCGVGYALVGGDCDDTRASVFPGNVEVCDGLDNDCDGTIDDGLVFTYYPDADGDGRGNPTYPLTTCNPPSGYVLNSQDCDDTRSFIYVGAPEVCDGFDNDCDGSVDPGFITTYCTAGTTVNGCVPSISGTGVPSSQSTTGFDLVVSQVPAQRYGLIFYGSWAIPQPQSWALGSPSYLCIYFPTARTGVQDTGGVPNTCTGELRVDFNAFMAANPAATGAPFHAGQVLHAQGWFRDPGAAKQTNLSDALTFTLCN